LRAHLKLFQDTDRDVVEAQLRLAGNHLAGLFDRDRREQPGCVKTTRSRLENKQD